MDCEYKVPRNFKLLDELDDAKNWSNISYGLVRGDDTYLVDWNGMILDKKNQMISLTIKCGDDYPDKPPLVHFTSEYVFPRKFRAYVRSEGRLSRSFPTIKNWKREYTIGMLLTEIREAII